VEEVVNRINKVSENLMPTIKEKGVHFIQGDPTHLPCTLLVRD
jgi:hypothetical protein